MNLKERMTKSIENFIRVGGSSKTMELDTEKLASNDDEILDFRMEHVSLTEIKYIMINE